jgi:hypothetical protein
MWAVRRVRHLAADSAFAELIDPQARAVGQAMFMQFQAQIDELTSPFVLPDAVTARTHFRFLPAVGLVPVPEERNANDAETTHFFKELTYRGPAFINGAHLGSLVRESADYPPIDTERHELVWLYRVRENRRAIDVSTTTPRPRSFCVFASGHMPYRAEARFDAAYMNYGNYALLR